jgi:hypothetical protein
VLADKGLRGESGRATIRGKNVEERNLRRVHREPRVIA